MRALAAVVILAACSLRCRARDDAPTTSDDRDTVSRDLLRLLGISPRNAIHNAVQCSQAIGPSKCLAALSIWRAKNALDSIETESPVTSKITDDIRRFPWQIYTNISQDEVEKQLRGETEKLLQYRALKLELLGYDLELMSKDNGTIKIDIFRGEATNTARGMKKTFARIVPILIVPGLIMSAILPFVLPALGMMTFGVGAMNNMALSSAVFTLLRNKGSNNKYKKKVYYVKDYYRNEEPDFKHPNDFNSDSIYEVEYDDKHSHDFIQRYPRIKVQDNAPNFANEGEYDIIEELPSFSNNDWIRNYYGHKNKYVRFANQDYYNDKRKSLKE